MYPLRLSILFLNLILVTNQVSLAIDEIEEESSWHKLGHESDCTKGDLLLRIRISKELAREEPDQLRKIMDLNIITINDCLESLNIYRDHRRLFNIATTVLNLENQDKIRIGRAIDDELIDQAAELLEKPNVFLDMDLSYPLKLRELDDYEDNFWNSYNFRICKPCSSLMEKTAHLRYLWDVVAEKDPDYEIRIEVGSHALELADLEQICEHLKNTQVSSEFYFKWFTDIFKSMLMDPNQDKKSLDAADTRRLIEWLINRGELDDDYKEILKQTDPHNFYSDEQLDNINLWKNKYNVKNIINLYDSSYSKLFNSRIGEISSSLRNIDYGKPQHVENLDNLIDSIAEVMGELGILNIFEIEEDRTDYLVRGMARYWKNQNFACTKTNCINLFRSKTMKKQINHTIEPICSAIRGQDLLRHAEQAMIPLAVRDLKRLKKGIPGSQYMWVIRYIICRRVMRDEIRNEDIVRAYGEEKIEIN